MIEQKEHFHGSDLEKIEKIYGIKKENIVSFAANVNPLGESGKLKTALSERIDAITKYPDREYTSLRKAIGSYCKCDYNHITVGNGCTELISLFIQITAPKKTLLLGPTYSEYERDLRINGSDISYHFLKEKDDFKINPDEFISAIAADTDLVIICNPNNPTGSLITPDKLKTILTHCKETNTYVMIDETYIEFVPDVNELSAIPLTELFDNVIILRGTSKFFATPGLRLGYAITSNSQILTAINTNKNPWMINSLAVVAGETMFLDEEYIDKTRSLILSEKTRCRQLIEESHKFKLYLGDTFSFGKHTVTFVGAPMVHWPEAMVTLDVTDGVLFSADAFGTFGALDGKLFADEVDFERDWLDDARRYLTNIVGKYGPHIQLLLKKAGGVLDQIKYICPLHGPVWRKDLGWFIEKYDTWSRYAPETQGVLIVYASMYGNTENAAQALATSLCDKGMSKVAMYDVSSTHVSQLISEAFKYSHIVLASVTYNLGIYPAMHDFLMDMKALNLQNRTFAIIENGSWAVKSGDLMQKFVNNELKNMTVLNERLSLASSMGTDKRTELEALADAILESMK